MNTFTKAIMLLCLAGVLAGGFSTCGKRSALRLPPPPPAQTP